MIPYIWCQVFMSPVSPLFHTIEAVSLSLNSKGTNTPSQEIKMSMLECRALLYLAVCANILSQKHCQMQTTGTNLLFFLSDKAMF